MPSMANITVKKNDGVTDVTYFVATASGGDKSPAVWKSSVGASPAFRPTLTISAEWNGPRTARRVKYHYSYPYTTTDAQGKTIVSDRAIVEGSMLVPQSIPDADIAEAIAQSTNLVASTLVKDTGKAGYAPT